MTSKKPVKSVSNMNVLGDIRGLLSSSQGKTVAKEAQTGEKAVSQADTTALDEEVKRYKAIVEKRDGELDRLKSEYKILAQKQLDEINKLKNDNKALLQKQLDDIEKLKSDNKTLNQKQSDETARPKNDNKAQVQKLQEEIDKLKAENKGMVQKQQELDKLKNENKELLAKLDSVTSAKAKPASPGAGKIDLEIAQMQANKEELSKALSQVESILQLKSKELMGRLARVYQEAAQGEIALEFRKGRDQLESLENLAHFVQALLNE